MDATLRDFFDFAKKIGFFQIEAEDLLCLVKGIESEEELAKRTAEWLVSEHGNCRDLNVTLYEFESERAPEKVPRNVIVEELARISRENEEEKCAAIEALGVIGFKIAAVHVIPFLNDKDPVVVLHAVKALGDIEEEMTTPLLLGIVKKELAKDPKSETELLSEAIGSLGWRGNLGALEPMIGLLEYPKWKIRRMIINTVSIISRETQYEKKVNDLLAKKLDGYSLEETYFVANILALWQDERALDFHIENLCRYVSNENIPYVVLALGHYKDKVMVARRLEENVHKFGESGVYAVARFIGGLSRVEVPAEVIASLSFELLANPESDKERMLGIAPYTPSTWLLDTLNSEESAELLRIIHTKSGDGRISLERAQELVQKIRSKLSSEDGAVDNHLERPYDTDRAMAPRGMGNRMKNMGSSCQMITV